MAEDALEIRDYLDSDSARAEQIHDLGRPIELEGSCDPRGFVPLAKDESDRAEFLSAKKFVAVLNNELVGFIGIQTQEIGWLYVDPTYFAQGIGRKLLQHGLKQLTGRYKAVEVHVLSGNHRAKKLYQSEGFLEASRFEAKNNGYPCTVIKLVRA
ncbi:MAG: ribosomal protein S18 acetylase RimI-like enzyme [Patiriisocius sp.]